MSVIRAYAVVVLSLLFGLSANAGAAPDDILPKTKEGWRFERLDFPLDFAPDLGLEGFEELRFAPGMFDPNSDSYFSYAFGMRILSKVTFDRAFVTNLLEKYYRGLCESVGGSRGLELDLSGFSVKVQDRGGRFTAKVEMVDAFVTAKPLTLRLEMSARPLEKGEGFELLGIASPKPRDAAIWKDLLALMTAFEPKKTPPIPFNHLYVVPPPEVYEAIKSSEFLTGEFGVFEERITNREDLSYSGLYFYGRSTYFEFLKADPERGFGVGRCGIAFGVDEKGGRKHIVSALKGLDIQAFEDVIDREWEGEMVPWFHIVGFQSATTTSPLQLFAMEYREDFLQKWHPTLNPQGGGMTRRHIMGRYASSLNKSPLRREGYLSEVVGVSLALDKADRDHLVRIVKAFGYEIVENKDGVVCRGPGFDIELIDDEGARGMRSIRLALQREDKASETLSFGRGFELQLKGKEAMWRVYGDGN